MNDTKIVEENYGNNIFLENNKTEFIYQDESINKKENDNEVDKRREIGTEENCFEATEMNINLDEVEYSTETLTDGMLEHLKYKHGSDDDKGPETQRFEMEVLDGLQIVNESVYVEISEDTIHNNPNEFSTKETFQQKQYIDDLKQMNGIITELQQKLANAYEDVKDQMNIADGWRKKMQEIKEEMNELKLVVIEQNRKVDLFEKKQIITISEVKMLKDQLEMEKNVKERLEKEREMYLKEKHTVEEAFSKTKQELETTEKKLVLTQHNLKDIMCHQTSELENITECERRLQCQTEQIDKLLEQVQWLEKNRVTLEKTLEYMKKEKNIRDEEQEEALRNTQKKFKVLEQQLEKEHKERTLLQREKLQMEKRLLAAAELERFERAKLQGVKRDMKRMKALLKDVQSQLERQKVDASGKVIIKQLKNQIEDLECARTIAVKAKHSLETDLLEIQFQLEGTLRHKQDEEERATALLRDKIYFQNLLEENEKEIFEVLSKFEETIANMSLDHELHNEESFNAELENHSQQSPELSVNFEFNKDLEESKTLSRYVIKVNELTSTIKLEHITKTRLELQIKKLNEAHDKVKADLQSARIKEQEDQNQICKLQRQLKKVKEELNKNAITFIKKNDLEKRYELLEIESANVKNDLKLALKRIEYLQSALQGSFENITLESSDSEPDNPIEDLKKKGSPTFKYNFAKTEK